VDQLVGFVAVAVAVFIQPLLYCFHLPGKFSAQTYRNFYERQISVRG
jgi:hypothetical protein